MKAIQQRTAQNQDTVFLKIIAVLSMVTDHVGKAFFPTFPVLQIIGRIAFPIFAYCLAVGCLYTRDMRKYLVRLFIFAVISQPFYLLNFYGGFENYFYLNIFFTLFFGALVIYGLMDAKRRFLLLALCMVVCIIHELLHYEILEYGMYGIALILAFYMLRDSRWLSALVAGAVLIIPFSWAPYITVGGVNFGMQGFAVLAMPFIFIRTGLDFKINKYFFYAFYPVHIFVILMLKNVL